MKISRDFKNVAFALAGSLLFLANSTGIQAKTLAIQEQGSFFVGQEHVFSETGNDTRVISSRNPGTVTINQMYVQFQIPAKKKFKYPIILMHGGGHEGKVYETTPDGREGWATYFLRQGFAVYNVDATNRGASGFDMRQIALVAQENADPDTIPRMNKYTKELACTQFRIGTFPDDVCVQHDGGQFPLEAFLTQYTSQLVPAFRDDTVTPTNTAALVALLDRIGPAIFLSWSQSGHFMFHASVERPGLVKGHISLEPSGISRPEGESSQLDQDDLEVLNGIPILLQVGDFDEDRETAMDNFAGFINDAGPEDNASVLNLPRDHGITGNGHVVMLEKNNLEVADLIIDWIKNNVD